MPRASEQIHARRPASPSSKALCRKCAPPGAPRSLSSQPIRLSAPASVALGGTWPFPRCPAGPKLLRLVLPTTPSEGDTRPRINQQNLRNAIRQCPHSVTNDRQPRVSILPTFDPDPELPLWVNLRRPTTTTALPVCLQQRKMFANGEHRRSVPEADLLSSC